MMTLLFVPLYSGANFCVQFFKIKLIVALCNISGNLNYLFKPWLWPLLMDVLYMCVYTYSYLDTYSITEHLPDYNLNTASHIFHPAKRKRKKKTIKKKSYNMFPVWPCLEQFLICKHGT